MSGGSVLLANQTVLRDNKAPTGACMLIEADAFVAYGLPAPLGHWIAESFVCEKSRTDAVQYDETRWAPLLKRHDREASLPRLPPMRFPRIGLRRCR